MKKMISSMLICTILLAVTGCTGPFALTKKVHAWQTGFDNKWVDEVAFLGCAYLPVYGLAALGDAIIFNSVEFWTGDNPMDSVDISKDGTNIKMTHRADGSILIESETGDCVLEKSAEGVSALDAEGNVLYSATTDNGKVRVYDAAGKEIHTFIKS